MQNTIFIAPDAGRQWCWSRGGEARTGSLDELATWLTGRDGRTRLVLLVPGEDVLLARVPMPDSGPARIARALPFAMEEHVLEDPAGLHCVAGPRVDSGTITGTAISRERLAGLLGELGRKGIRPDHACPDCLLVPWREGTIAVLTDGYRALVRWGDCDATAIETVSLPALLDGLTAGDDRDSLEVSRREADGTAGCLEALDPGAAPPSVDLLQGAFLPERRQAGWRTWRLPAALAAALFLLLLVHEGLATRQLAASSKALADEISAGFRAAFPEVSRVQADPAPQITIELRRLRQQAGSGGDLFLELLGRAAPILTANPGVRLERLDFGGAELELGLTAGQIADLDRLRSQFQAAGLTARQGAAQLDNGRVSGSVSVSLSPAPDGGGRS